MDLPLFFTLPLIGGFAFVTSLWSLRWRSARQDSQRLYYRAAVYGILIAAGVAVAHAALLELPSYRRGFEWIYASFLKPLFTTKDAPPEPTLIIKAHVALVCVYALALGIVAPQVLNRVGRLWGSGRDTRVVANLASITDPLELLLSRSLLNGEAIQVTLSTGKMYVGYVLEAPDPDLPTKFIKVQPLMSGQRGSDGQVNYTTFYDEILTEFEANPDMRAELDTFQLVVPVDKVVTLSGFSLDAYVHFLSDRQEQSGEAVKGNADATIAIKDLWLPVVGMALGKLFK